LKTISEQFATIFGAPMSASQIAAEVDAMHAVASFDTINAYFDDHRPFEAEREVERARCHAAIDHGMARLNAEQQRRWAAEEQPR
jgi:methionyl-tRNA synthetase